MSLINRNKKNQSWIFYVSAIGCLISIFTFVAIMFQSGNQPKVASADEYNSAQIIAEVNKKRIENGAIPLRENPQLSKAAQDKVQDMTKNSYFSHISPVDGAKWSDFIKNSGYKYDEAGENLANGFNTVPEMVVAWMESPSHKENMLSQSVEETGVGISRGRLNGYPTIFVAQVFGRKDVLNPPIKKTSITDPAKVEENSFGDIILNN